jgi:late control gene D protein (GPD)
MPVPQTPVTPCFLIGEGETQHDVGSSLLELEVEEHHELAGVFRTKVAIVRGEDGLWTNLDQNGPTPWTRVEIKFNLGDREEPVMTGYVTQIRVHIDASEGASYLELVGMDATSLMSVEEVIKDWPGKSDSEIASEIFEKYGLDTEVESTDVTHDDTLSTIIQRESDIQFLKRLSRRNGFECVVVGDTGIFGKPALDGDPLPVLAAHFGDDTNLTTFDAAWNALRPSAAEYHQIDVVAKEVSSSVVETSALDPLGRDGAVLPTTLPAGATPRVFVRHEVATGVPEMDGLANAVVDEASWFLEARGEVDSVRYGDILHARRVVPIKGVGELLSGLYYLTSVKHLYNTDRYTQSFVARRNATVGRPDDFGDSGSGLPGL